MTAALPLMKSGAPVALALALCSVPCVALADGLSGFLEYGFGSSTNKLQDVSGATTSSRSTSFLQRYNLAFDRSLYPTLFIKGGGFSRRPPSKALTKGLTAGQRCSA
ncbi:hypothetical protein [Citrifermentans bemidjiense]|uniref:hypothetical protein n=1 Tax=Citrifermentans bemidjiense TaxID=225194 RepID=UPI0011D0E34E|nr:hypothetical protein [Citrifermentans bemidjiense]